MIAARRILAERLTAQLLSGAPAGNVEAVVERLLAVQAQDPRGARLAIRSRSVGLSAADVDHALTTERTVVVTTVNRGTLHLIRSEDYWWLHSLTTPQLTTSTRRGLDQDRISPAAADRAIVAIERALAIDGPLTREQLRAQIAVTGIRLDGHVIGRLLLLATVRGLIVRGPVVGGDHAFVLVRDWLGPAPAAIPREVALGELTRRYLAGHGPASELDLAKWAGITLGDARRGLSAISAQLIDRDDGLASVVDRYEPAALPPPRLLGAFDPSLHGWVSREPIIGSHVGIVTTNGIFRPFAMVNGRAVATWTLTKGTVRISPFDRLTRSATKALDVDSAAVLEFLR